MDRVLSICKALADRNRMRILAALLHEEELCACQITELLRVSGATASRHLGQMVTAGLLRSRKEGRWVYYRVNPEGTESREGIAWLKKALMEDPELEEDRAALKTITACDPEEICRRQRGEACCPSPNQIESPSRSSP